MIVGQQHFFTLAIKKRINNALIIFLLTFKVVILIYECNFHFGFMQPYYFGIFV